MIFRTVWWKCLYLLSVGIMKTILRLTSVKMSMLDIWNDAVTAQISNGVSSQRRPLSLSLSLSLILVCNNDYSNEGILIIRAYFWLLTDSYTPWGCFPTGTVRGRGMGATERSSSSLCSTRETTPHGRPIQHRHWPRTNWDINLWHFWWTRWRGEYICTSN